jgi:hypothetical protein
VAVAAEITIQKQEVLAVLVEVLAAIAQVRVQLVAVQEPRAKAMLAEIYQYQELPLAVAVLALLV